MRKEFESGLARRIAGNRAEKRVLGKAWMAVVLGAVLLAGSAATAAAVWNGDDNGAGAVNGDADRLRDESCLEEPVADPDCICDCPCDCTCPDCPCCDGTV